jgi:hypothetical protein
MTGLKRTLAGLMFLLAAIGLIATTAAGIGVWVAKPPVTNRATHLYARIEASIDVADQGLEQVQRSLTLALERLGSARDEQRRAAQQPSQAGGIRRTLARTVQRTLAPEIGDAQGKLHTVAEAAIVVNTVLEDVGNFPFLSAAGFDLERLTEMNNRLAGVGPAAWELSRMLGESPSNPTAEAADVQLSQIDQTLESMQRMLADFRTQVSQVRVRTETLKSRTLHWITPAVATASLICLWIALSQVCLMAHARSWWRRC